MTPDKVRELVSRLKCPTEADRNAEFRAKVVSHCDSDPEFAQAMWERCENGPVFWMNSFGWTQNPKDFPQNPDQPIILFPNQAKYILKLHENVEKGRPLLLEKSREQLASVGTANYCLWRWIFKQNANIKIGSMKEELVDGDSYADQIMPKMDFTLARLPVSMQPPGYTDGKPHKTYMKRKNPATGRVIKGEAANKHFSVGGRYALVWFDEFSKAANQRSVHRKIANTTNCFLYTTTPEGWEMFAEMVASKNYDVVRLHWTGNYLWHPKGYTPEQCDWDNGIWPAEWICQPGCKAHPGGGKPHSERYDNECEKLGWNKQDIAQELDIDYARSGNSVFNADVIIKCREAVEAANLKFKYISLDWVKDGQLLDGEKNAYFKATRKWNVIAKDARNSALRVYKEPFSCRDKDCLCEGSGRHVYGVGSDVSKGLPHGDRSVAYIVDLTICEVVAELCSQAEPDDFAEELMKLIKYYGKSSGCDINPFTTCEWNDQGLIVNKYLMLMGLGQSQFSYVSDDKIRSKKIADKLGNVVGPANRGRLLDDYLAPAIGKDRGDGLSVLFVPFVEFWHECENLVRKSTDTGDLGADKPRVARVAGKHDDRPMALLHALFGARFQYQGKIKGVIRRKWAPPGYERRLQMEKLEAIRKKTGADLPRGVSHHSVLQSSLPN